MNGERLPNFQIELLAACMGISSPFEINLSPLLEHGATTLLLPPFLAHVFKCKLLEVTCHIIRALFARRSPFETNTFQRYIVVEMSIKMAGRYKKSLAFFVLFLEYV